MIDCVETLRQHYATKKVDIGHLEYRLGRRLFRRCACGARLQAVKCFQVYLGHWHRCSDEHVCPNCGLVWDLHDYS